MVAKKTKADIELDDIEKKLIKKKNVVPKKRTPKQIEIDKIVKIVAPNIIDEGAEWATVEITTYKRRINWLGILRMLNKVGKDYRIIGKGPGEKRLWARYCNWWNLHINKIDPNENLYEAE